MGNAGLGCRQLKAGKGSIGTTGLGSESLTVDFNLTVIMNGWRMNINVFV